MNRRLPVLALALVAAAVPSQQTHALTLEFAVPAEITGARGAQLSSYSLPVGAFDGNLVPSRRLEGLVDQIAYRLPSPGATTLELLLPLREQLAAAGYATVYECETAGCGGFDFRYGITVLPEPEMHVDLGDFRYLAAERSGATGPEAISLMVSRSADHGFVQMTRVSATTGTETALSTSTKTETPGPDAAPVAVPDQVLSPRPFAAGAVTVPAAGTPNDITTALDGGGVMALDDLVFPTGTAALADGEFASLADLALWLKANPERRVALVGHTDASGGLAANIALSRKRAESVRQRLLYVHGIPAGQIAAEGVGYLSPRANNLTEEGRARNRRVEVIVTSTQ